MSRSCWISTLGLFLSLFWAPGSSAQSPQPIVVEPDAEPNFDFCCTVKVKDAKVPVTPASVLLGLKPGATHLMLTLTAEALTLSRATQDNATVLGEVRKPYAPPTPEGVRLVLQWRNGKLCVIYGGRTLLRREGVGTLQGAVALAPGEGNLQFVEPRCQPVEPVYFADDFMRSASEPGLWQTVAGTWRMNAVGDPSLGANPFAYVAQGKPAMAVTGHWFWNDYGVSVSVRSSGDGSVGLAFYWQDPANYVLFKWRSENDPNWVGKEKQLWKVIRGQPSLIIAAPGGYRPKQWYRLSVIADEGLVYVLVDGQNVLQTRSDLFGQGKVGLYREGDTDATFDDVVVRSVGAAGLPDASGGEVITPQFAREQTMEEWATPKGEWLPDPKAPATTFWNRGAFFGDHALELKATGMVAGSAKLTAVLCGDGDSPGSGYGLVVTRTTNNQRVEAVLLRQGKPVTSPRNATVATASVCPTKLQRTGSTIRGFVGDAMVASFDDPQPLTGHRAGYVAQGAQVLYTEARVSADNVYDYTFYRAPTDWYTGSGTWEVTNRWVCSPQWSWYGGWSDRIAAIWNKHSFAGDLVIEVFVASKMDSANPPYYLHPRDFNITIAGDGRDLASGYSCIFAGWNNTFTRLLRGTQTVGQTNQVLLPANYHDTVHRKWFCLRVEKLGDAVSFYVDRKLTLRYKDPQRLTGRKIALWTCGNGIMIARATIYYEREVGFEPTPHLLRAADGLPSVPAENLRWQVRGGDAIVMLDAVPGERPAVRAVNVDGGGTFALTPQLEPFDVLKMPKLSFQCRLAPGTEISLYLRVKGAYHAVRLTGPSEETEQAKILGAASAVRADGKWHNVDLELAALLRPLYPKETQLVVEEIFLGNLSRDPYRQAGFGANYPGTNYLVRAFTLRSSDNLVAKLIEPQLRGPLPGTALAQAPTEPKQERKAVAPIGGSEPAPARGLFDLKATYCQDPDFGDFRMEMLNQPIPWQCFKKPVFTEVANLIDFDWTEKSPGRKMSETYWSARFVGKLLVPKEGDYVFYLERLDDGGRLYVDGKPVIDAWLVQPPASHASEPLRLAAGVHDLRLDYCQGTLAGSVTLCWSSSHFAKEIIPKTSRPGSRPPRKQASLRLGDQ